MVKLKGVETLNVHPVFEQLLGADALFAARLVARAMRLLRRIRAEARRNAVAKDDASPVTIADFAIQALVADAVARAYPEDVLVAEEGADYLRRRAAADLRDRVTASVRSEIGEATTADVLAWIDRGLNVPGHRSWVLDPVDGTKGLLRGGQYVTALSMIVDGLVELGVIGCPCLSLHEGRRVMTAPDRAGGGGIAIALRGRGAWWLTLDGRYIMRLFVSAVLNPASVRAVHSFEGRHSDAGRFDRTLRVLGADRVPPLLLDSQAKHVLVAGGHADLLLRFPTDPGYRANIWDEAAGSLLIREAGGRVTDLSGRELDFGAGRQLCYNVGLVASNGAIHTPVLAQLADLFGTSRIVTA